MTETIVALSTPPGEAALHVIRMSGPQAENILNECFQTHSEAWRQGNVFMLCLGWFCQGEKKIDQILAVRMRAPYSFTGEDLVEIHCHGGMVNVRRILDVCCGCGARLAEPGEFSKRAFLNGKMDLVQAEALIDLITAKNDLSADLALLQMEGLSGSIGVLKDELTDVLAGVEAHIDFPDDMQEEDILERDLLKDKLFRIRESMEEALGNSQKGRIIRDGIRTVIAGVPNVGKSSLLNAFVGEERAIVTNIPGTTRDEIHEYVHLGESFLHLIDTAGLRESDDPIEILGIERTRKALDEADIILLLVDGTRLFGQASVDDRGIVVTAARADVDEANIMSDTKRGAEEILQGGLLPQEEEILKQYGQKTIVLVNKMDLLGNERRKKSGMRNHAASEVNVTIDNALNLLEDKQYLPPLIPFSVKTHRGFDVLQDELKRRFLEGFNMNKSLILSNMRHIEAMRRSFASVEKAINSVDMNVPFDLISIDIMVALEEISLITGHDVREEVIGQIFQRFCIGK